VTTTSPTVTSNVFIGNGPHGAFTTFADPAIIEGWIADGYAHAGHEHGDYRTPHIASLCPTEPKSALSTVTYHAGHNGPIHTMCVWVDPTDLDLIARIVAVYLTGDAAKAAVITIDSVTDADPEEVL
jgi:hypothetical protein